MTVTDPSADNPLLRVSIPRRAESLVKWLFARPSERRGCLAIARCGGTYDFSHRFPFVSPTHNIYIRRNCFSDAHMEHLRSFRGLVAADIGDTSVTERGVACLLDCAALRYLFLWGTQVGDGIINVLCEMPKLDMLNLSGTHVSRDTFERVRGFLPNAFISHTEYGDHYREFSGKEASMKWIERDEPSVATKSPS